jgi:hypothetical protein
LYHVPRNPGVPQAGSPGMAETGGLVEVHYAVGSIAHVQPAGTLTEHGTRRLAELGSSPLRLFRAAGSGAVAVSCMNAQNGSTAVISAAVRESDSGWP